MPPPFAIESFVLYFLITTFCIMPMASTLVFGWYRYKCTKPDKSVFLYTREIRSWPWPSDICTSFPESLSLNVELSIPNSSAALFMPNKPSTTASWCLSSILRSTSGPFFGLLCHIPLHTRVLRFRACQCVSVSICIVARLKIGSDWKSITYGAHVRPMMIFFLWQIYRQWGKNNKITTSNQLMHIYIQKLWEDERIKR